MPTLNRIRLVNIRFNDDKRVVQDELLNINEQHTLALLENAGGKSVLTKFMMQPIMWVYDKYPSRSSSPYFDMRSYFKTNTEPCYVLEEFILENNEGYLLLGVGITKGEENGPLKKIAFVHHYTNLGNEYSIQNIPLFSRKNGGIVLLGLNEVYSTLKPHMNCYRSAESSHKQEFRNKLLEYHINIKEWEKIHARVVSMEGGLAEVFANSSTKSTTDLLRNWILEAIEGKVGYITEDKTQIELIKTNLQRYIQMKIESRADMEQLEQLRLFVEEVSNLYQLTLEKEATEQAFLDTENNLIHISRELHRLKQALTEYITACDNAIQLSCLSINTLKYQKESNAINEKCIKIAADRNRLQELDAKKKEIDELLVSICYKINLQEARKQFDELIETQSNIDLKKEALLPMSEKVKELEEKTRNIKYTIRQICEKEVTLFSQDIDRKKEQEASCVRGMQATKDEIKKENDILQKYMENQVEFRRVATRFETKREQILNEYSDIPFQFVFKDFVEELELSRYLKEARTIMEALSGELTRLKEEEKEKKLRVETTGAQKQTDELSFQKQTSDLERVNQEYETYLSEKSKITDMLKFYRFKEAEMDRLDMVLIQLEKAMTTKEQMIREAEKKQDKIMEQINFFQYDQLKLHEAIEKSLRQNGVDYILGLSYLKNCDLSMEEKIQLIRQVPVLPYAILVSSGNYEKIKKIMQKEFTDAVIPVLLKENLEQYSLTRENSLFLTEDGLGLYGGYNEELIDAEYARQKQYQAEQNLEVTQKKIAEQRKERDDLIYLCNTVQNYPYDKTTEAQLLAKISVLKHSVRELDNGIQEKSIYLATTKERINLIFELIKSKEEEHKLLEEKIAAVQTLTEQSETYFNTLSEIDRIKANIEAINAKTEVNREAINEFIETNANIKNEIRNLENVIQNLKSEDAEFFAYEEVGSLEMTEGGELKSKKVLKNMLSQYQNRSEYNDIRLIQDDIVRLQRKEETQKVEFNQTGINASEVKEISYHYESLRSLKNEKQAQDKKSRDVGNKIAVLESEINKLAEDIEKSKVRCRHTFQQEYDSNVKTINFDLGIQKEEENKEQQKNARGRYCSMNEDMERMLPDLAEFLTRSIKGQTALVDVSFDNYREMYKQFQDNYRRLEKKLNEIVGATDKIFMHCNNTYVVKRNNKMIGEYLAKMQSYLSSHIFQDVKAHLLKQIDLYSGEEVMLKEQFEQIYGTSLDYTKKVHEELLTMDKNSKINNRKLFELGGIAKEGMEEKFDAFLSELTDNIVNGVKDINYLDKVVTTYNLLDNFISLDAIQAYALKFNAFDEQIKVMFEDTHNGGVCSGAQRTIITFAILKCIMYYTNEGLIKDSRNATSFMFLDNPFGVMSTDQFLDLFFEIANRFHTTLYSWTDLNKPVIIKKHKNIYSFKISKVGKKEYMTIRDEIDKDSYETVNTDYLQEETSQLEFKFSM